MPQQSDLAHFRQRLSSRPCLPPTQLLPKPCQLPACKGAGSARPPATAPTKLFQCVSLPWFNCCGGSAKLPPLPDLTAETTHPRPLPHGSQGNQGPERGNYSLRVTQKVLSRVGIGPLCSLSLYPVLGVALPQDQQLPKDRPPTCFSQGSPLSCRTHRTGPTRVIEITMPTRGLQTLPKVLQGSISVSGDRECMFHSNSCIEALQTYGYRRLGFCF